MYPTMEQINNADHEQICRWWRSLKRAGTSAIGKDDFYEAFKRETAIIKRIGERLKEFGGFTPEISKNIGWE